MSYKPNAYARFVEAKVMVLKETLAALKDGDLASAARGVVGCVVWRYTEEGHGWWRAAFDHLNNGVVVAGLEDTLRETLARCGVAGYGEPKVKPPVAFGEFYGRTGRFPMRLRLIDTGEVLFNWGCRSGFDLSAYLRREDYPEPLAAPVLRFLSAFEEAHAEEIARLKAAYQQTRLAYA